MSKVIMMCGVCGSGKTAYAKKKAQEGYIRLSIDEEMWKLYGKMGVDYPQAQYEKLSGQVEAALQKKLLALIRQGNDVVIDFSFWSKKDRDHYKELIQNAGAETELVYMKASKALLRKRLHARNQTLHANAPFVITDEILEHHWRAFQEPQGEGEKIILQDIMQYSTEESKAIWNGNAEFWDRAMGDASNAFHREVVRPKVTELLNPEPTDYILDIACGNGNYSAYLAQKGISVLAFDYSENMIALAEKRQKRYADSIEFCVADATSKTSLMGLKRSKPFTKAVSNMALMDITHIEPLFDAVYQLLADDGIFVFATQHPCFVTLTEKYMTPHSYYDIAIEGQPQKQCYYHRSLQDIFHICFDAGFVIDGFYESCYFDQERPDIIIVRVKKRKAALADTAV